MTQSIAAQVTIALPTPRSSKPSLSHRNNEGQCAEKAEAWRARAGAGMAATLMRGWLTNSR